MVRYREDAGISAGHCQIHGTTVSSIQCVSPDCPPSVLYSNLNVSTSTYRSTTLGTGGLTEWDDASREWRGFGPCLWGSAQHLSPRFGVWMGGLDVCSCGSCQGKSVSRSQALGVGHCGQVGKKAKEKKKSKVQLWPGLGPSLCNPASASHGKAWVRSGPTCTRNSLTSSPAISPNSKIRKPPAPVPALFVLCACAPACL